MSAKLNSSDYEMPFAIDSDELNKMKVYKQEE
jgi:hypothetical protein